LGENFKNIYCTNLFITSLHNILKELKNDMIESKELPYEILSKTIEIQKQIFQKQKTANLLDTLEIQSSIIVLDILQNYQKEIEQKIIKNGNEAFEYIKQHFNVLLQKREKEITQTTEYLNNAFLFLEKAFGENQEIVIFITELTSNYYSIKFINENGSEKYYYYNQSLLFQQGRKEILQKIAEVTEELKMI
jgi:hypothetical protein